MTTWLLDACRCSTRALVLSLVACGLWAGNPSATSAQSVLAIKGGTVITMAGSTIENGTVVIRDGKIVAVGSDVEVPVEARVIDASGKTVMPGFIDPHNSSGLSQANENNVYVPYVSVLDGIDPTRSYFDDARRNGVTSVAVVPGNSTMIGGQAAVIKTGGMFVDYMVLKKDAGIKISLQPQGGGSRMGHLAALRQALDNAVNPDGDESESSDEEESDEEESDEGEEEGEEGDEEEGEDEEDEGERSITNVIAAQLEAAMQGLVQGEIPAIIYCENSIDVQHALALIEQYQLDPILVLGEECHQAAEQLAAKELTVILDPTLVFWETDARTGEDRKVVLPRIYNEAGVPFTFQSSDSNDTLGSNFLWYQAATAMRYGLSEEQALEALTTLPARIYGIDSFVGTLEPGKDGDVIILTGHPLKIDTWVDTTIVNGEVVYEREHDPKLKRLLEGAAE